MRGHFFFFSWQHWGEKCFRLESKPTWLTRSIDFVKASFPPFLDDFYNRCFYGWREKFRWEGKRVSGFRTNIEESIALKRKGKRKEEEEEKNTKEELPSLCVKFDTYNHFASPFEGTSAGGNIDSDSCDVWSPRNLCFLCIGSRVVCGWTFWRTLCSLHS